MATHTCTEHTFRIYREEWTERSAYVDNGVLHEGYTDTGATTAHTIKCAVCELAPNLKSVHLEAEDEWVWQAAPGDDEEAENLRAAHFTVEEEN